MKNRKIIIAGGTGFIGQSLIKYIGNENEIVILSRQSGDSKKNLYSKKLITKNNDLNVRYIKWNGKTMEENWSREIDGADMVINLAGKSVNCRYHKKQKKEIFDSRTNPTKAIGEAIRNAVHPPRVWINSASATIYKDSCA